MDNSEVETFSLAMELASGSVLPMALKTVVELNLLELIKNIGPGVSASDLAAHLPTTNPNACTMIDRILRLLAAHSVVICHLVGLPNGDVERRYSLAPVCKFLTKNEDGVSLAPLVLLQQDGIYMDMWCHLKDAILDGREPFDRARGMSIYDYTATDPRFNQIFNQAMFAHTTIYMNKILKIYKGFEGLKSLVDVGGGTGATLEMIKAKYSFIHGINFDLPHVLLDAPLCSMLDHVSGDMFVSVPKADAILLKWILHNWNDEHCEILLKNCYESLPDAGKVIVIDSIIGDGESPNGGLDLKFMSAYDVLMMGGFHGGKERSEKEFQNLAKEVGFKEVKLVCCVFHIWVMEFHK